MLKPADNILFAGISCLPQIDKKKAVNKIIDIDSSLSFFDSYRNCVMYPLMTKNAGLGLSGTKNNQIGEFLWTKFTPSLIVDYFEQYVFPWLGTKTRVMALLTKSGTANNEHIDCDRNELNTKQHKFRIVLQGRTDTLYWLTDKGQVKAPNIDTAFIMDGGWPHGMYNDTNDVKITLALGAPWNGKDNYGLDIELLQDRNNFTLPNDLDKFWQK